MSLDISLMRFAYLDSTKKPKAKVFAILKTLGTLEPDQFGFYNIRFPDGGEAAFYAELQTDAPFEVCGFNLLWRSPEVFHFIFQVSQLGNMVICNAHGSNTPQSPVEILTLPAQIVSLPPSHLVPVRCSSAEHLAQLLGCGFGDWAAYRDQIISTDKA